MLPLGWYDACAFTTRKILEKIPPFGVLRFCLVDLFPEGSLRKIFHSDFFSYLNNLKNDFTAQEVSVRKEIHCRFAKFLKIIEELFMFLTGSLCSQVSEASCSPSVVHRVPGTWCWI